MNSVIPIDCGVNLVYTVEGATFIRLPCFHTKTCRAIDCLKILDQIELDKMVNALHTGKKEKQMECGMDVLRVDRLTKDFGTVRALDDVTFSIKHGDICGLLGPNGAGKTTLIRIIMDIYTADSGYIALDERFLGKSRKNHIGYLPEERGLYLQQTVRDTLLYFGRLKGLSREEALSSLDFFLYRLGMSSMLMTRIEKLSKGNQQKIQLIASLISRPALLILDEPFSGLDPINIQMVMKLLEELNHQGMSIVLSTHQMDQVEHFCRNLLFMNRGRLVLSGMTEEIITRFSGNSWLIETDQVIENSALFVVTSPRHPHVRITLHESVTVNDLLAHLLANNVTIRSLRPFRMTLSDIFIAVVTG